MYSRYVKITASKLPIITLFLISIIISFCFIYFYLVKISNINFQQFISTNKDEIANGDTLTLASKLNALSASENILRIEGQIDGKLFISYNSRHNISLIPFRTERNFESINHNGIKIKITYIADKYVLLAVLTLIASQLMFILIIFYHQKYKTGLLIEKNKLIFNISRQVAHDIRSPLSVLNMVTESLTDIDSEKKELIKSAVLRINDIAEDLLKKGKAPSFSDLSSNAAENNNEIILVTHIIDSLLSEKRIQFKPLAGIAISGLYPDQYESFVVLRPSDLKRVLSNLINNAVESFKYHSGSVKVALILDKKHAIIKIIDNGPGIPSHILEKLGKESVSFGKNNTESGSGLGVLHAKKTIEDMGGQFEITSTIGKGTEVKITLPLAEAPSWFLKKLDLKENSTILICDDDNSVILLWKKRLSDFPKINSQYFTDLESLKEFITENHNSQFSLLIDYEFSGEKQTGLDFIIENNLASKSILVTSHYDEPDVIQKCIDHNIKQIPKNICALVPIEMASSKEYYDAIVLDNEDLQVRSWQFAAIQKGKSILTFSNSDEFLSALSNIDHHTPIFIDSILGGDIKGEDIAKKINDLGFKNIYMSSGHDPSHFSDMTFLKGVIGKTPFFP